jgi:hypothetical protein
VGVPPGHRPSGGSGGDARAVEGGASCRGSRSQPSGRLALVSTECGLCGVVKDRGWGVEVFSFLLETQLFSVLFLSFFLSFIGNSQKRKRWLALMLQESKLEVAGWRGKFKGRVNKNGIAMYEQTIRSRGRFRWRLLTLEAPELRPVAAAAWAARTPAVVAWERLGVRRHYHS